ncbi:hypothetical protein SB776_40400, partial [Burkholderia sp. SIMBA_045]
MTIQIESVVSAGHSIRIYINRWSIIKIFLNVNSASAFRAEGGRYGASRTPSSTLSTITRAAACNLLVGDLQ